ncbi:sulfate adenylyltransferase subunit CysN [Candidatus Erwinia haradaeae]|uniref:Sulfate adenylyltransferase subunit 1 n=1 Tax=Candidatus Erwinia haradaeae TaxID=1922217 RepID=A0A451D8R4_9GAMM|nr:sulfate adenylyltransferase subunit CysN [Candidatus Erwinia haradaeae]VFP82239.1 Sulfate adenylyltransferase subunit 1 [Candidatus Erwinia haradaeae]
MNNIIPHQNLQSSIIENWLTQQKNTTLLRFLTCGSVDDGKSTLIGRLLHDTKQIYEDQLSTLCHDSKRHGTQGDQIDLALLVDGLQAEREQGITIDVAYRYFSTYRRKFIIADAPGHEQYTRNMATGASTCDLAILLIDSRKGLLNQTRRHSLITTLLGIKYLIVTINKMDLVNYSQDQFLKIKESYLNFSKQLPNNIDIHFIPLSALTGENVVHTNNKMPWYEGPTLLHLLETVNVQCNLEQKSMRFPIQYVNRPNLDFRGYSGTVASGKIEIGQKIQVLPSGNKSTITRIVTFDGDLPYANENEAITLVLKDELDISRGDLLINENEQLIAARGATVDVVWMAEKPLTRGQSFNIKIAGKKTRACIDKIHHQIDINNLTRYNSQELPLNAIGRVDIIFDELVPIDPYEHNRVTGAIIFIDRLNNGTVGAGMVRSALTNIATSYKNKFSEFELELNALVRRHFPHWGVCELYDR